jgi:biotin carboxyl carrier protein
MGRLTILWRSRGRVRSLFLQVMPLMPLLSGLIQCAGTLIERRRGTFRSSVLEQVAGSLFLASLSILFLLIWPWAMVGNLARYAMYLGLAVVAAHGGVASLLAYRAGKLLPARTGWVGSGLLVLMSLLWLVGVGHVFLAPFPDDQILIAFPGEGDWSVGQGGPSVLTNAHIPYANQRYALDLVKVGPDGKAFKGDGRQLPDYFSWGQAVRAPLSGKVTEAEKTYPDNEPGRFDDRDSRGNHVLIRSGAGEIVLLAHLRKESVLVEEGDWVQEGQVIAEVGNSGNTSAPHLHIDASRATQSGLVSVPMVFKETGAGLRSQRRGATLGRAKE